MSKMHTELMARVALAGGVSPTYREKQNNHIPKVEKALNKIDLFTTAAIRYFGKVGKDNIVLIGDRIDQMNEKSCLGKPRSILTFIDFSVEMLESSFQRDENGKMLANLKGACGRIYIRRLIDALLEFRDSVSNKDFPCCSIAGIKAADVWRSL